jgi:hypothetical protein
MRTFKPFKSSPDRQSRLEVPALVEACESMTNALVSAAASIDVLSSPTATDEDRKQARALVAALRESTIPASRNLVTATRSALAGGRS